MIRAARGAKIYLYLFAGLCFNAGTEINTLKKIPALAAGNGESRLARLHRPTTRKSMKSKKFAMIPLAKGQLWKMEDKHIEIMEVGKTLTHYRLFQNQKRVPISLGGIAAVQAYLRTNGAKLVRKAAALKA
jgi:hypothetical protein